jgi:hypothetical protein
MNGIVGLREFRIRLSAAGYNREPHLSPAASGCQAELRESQEQRLYPTEMNYRQFQIAVVAVTAMRYSGEGSVQTAIG